jgi:hypothetical protein
MHAEMQDEEAKVKDCSGRRQSGGAGSHSMNNDDLFNLISFPYFSRARSRKRNFIPKKGMRRC